MSTVRTVLRATARGGYDAIEEGRMLLAIADHFGLHRRWWWSIARLARECDRVIAIKFFVSRRRLLPVELDCPRCRCQHFCEPPKIAPWKQVAIVGVELAHMSLHADKPQPHCQTEATYSSYLRAPYREPCGVDHHFCRECGEKWTPFTYPVRGVSREERVV